LARAVVTGDQNALSCEPSTTDRYPASRPTREKRPAEQHDTLNVITPESFREPEQHQNIKLRNKVAKLIAKINAAALELPEFYETIWNTENRPQPQSKDALDRIAGLQQLINASVENESKALCQQRIGYILCDHELELISRSITDKELERGKDRKTLLSDRLSVRMDISKRELSEFTRHGKYYLFFFYEFGPGAVMRLGVGNKTL
jgi:hypothetical protein